MEHRSGKLLTADKLPKLGNVEEHRRFVAADIQGLTLLGYEYYNRVTLSVQQQIRVKVRFAAE